MPWNPTKEHDAQRMREEYARGREAARNETLGDEIMHGIGDIIGTVIPSSKEHQSREAGYHDEKSGNTSDSGGGSDSGSSGSGGSSGGCFLTTACVTAQGLPDNCLELETLRAFRDGYVARQPGGKALIKEYYRIAPGIVAAIEARSAQPGKVFADLYRDDIRTVLQLIDHGKDEAALRHYQGMVRRLERTATG